MARIIRDEAEQVLRDADTDRRKLGIAISNHAKSLIELRAALALLHLAMDRSRSAVWAVDRELTVELIANAEYPSSLSGVVWNVGKTVYELFRTEDAAHPAVAAHLQGLAGHDTEIRLMGEFASTTLRVVPLRDEDGTSVGNVSMLRYEPDR